MARPVGFSAGEQEAFTPLPKGSYEQQIDSFEEGNAKSGNRQFTVKTHVIGGPHDGKKVTHWFALTDKAGFRFRQLLDAACCPYDLKDSGKVGENGKPIYDFTFDADDLIGCRFIADAVVTEDNKGRPRNDWLSFRETEDAQKPAATNGQSAAGGQPATEVVGTTSEAPLRRDRRQSA